MAKARPEQLEQQAIMQLVQMHLGRVPLLNRVYHCPNGEWRPGKTGAILNSMGVSPGVPDLQLPAARRGYLGLVIELKAPGELAMVTIAQRGWLRFLSAEGWLAVACDDAQAGWRLLLWYATGARHHDGIEPHPLSERVVKYLPY